MSTLRDLVSVEHRSVRAVNLEVDLYDPDVLRGYSPGGHVIDALRRIAVSLQDGPRTRAWSITGPYGAGKSSFAHLLCSLLGSSSEPTHQSAVKLLRKADPQLAATLARERRRLGVEPHGVIPAAITAERESVTHALLRALQHGAERYWSGRPGRKPDILHRLRSAVHTRKPASDLVFSCLDELTGSAPVMIIVDELGKNLEYAAGHLSDGDLYVLQQLAERFSSYDGFAGGVLTLAHLAFEDYLVSSGDAQRREWRKVHGRFDDIPFVANKAHALGLLAEALTFTGTRSEREAVDAACREADEAVRAVIGQLPTPATVTGSASGSYPLHPAVAVALPSLASRLAQHDRSLVAFLTSDAPNALPAFLDRHRLNSSEIPFVRLDGIYDYFFQDGAATALTGAEGERAREIRTRVEEASGLEELEYRVLKSVAILNLVEGAEKVVASTELIEESIAGPHGTPKERRGVRAILTRLVERSLLAYREFAGEYRVWEGSDFDVRGQIHAARERLTVDRTSSDRILRIVEQAQPLRPAVASRHSQRHHVLRYFACRYAEGAPDDEVKIDAEGADGLVLWTLSEDNAPAKLPAYTHDGHPLVVVWSPYGSEVRDLALDFAAASAVLKDAPELARDVVARREIRHRVTTLQAALADRVDDAFSYHRSGVYWFSEGKRSRAQGPAEFSRLLSDICDRRYTSTPTIRNEMVNRSELTSQGAKARRVLIERMFTHEREPRLGIQGYGPERAMYEAVLHHTGLHAERGADWGFGPPPKDSELAGVWTHLAGLLDGATQAPLGVDDVYESLLSPPFGMKAGAVPLLLAAALQYRAEDIFLYQDGTFQPIVEPAHLERLLKTPERFALKRASLVGVRASIFAELQRALVPDGLPPSRRLRNETTLAVVRPLISFATALPEYTRVTQSTSETAQRVCRALLSAREPDELVFRTLPEACGLASFEGRKTKQADTRAGQYVDRLRRALAELGSTYQRLLERIGDLLHVGFGIAGPRTALREELRTRSRGLLQHVIEPKMRAFLMTAVDETLDDDDWIEALAMTLATRPPSSWSDHDLVSFEALVAERAQWFGRLELLYHQMHSGVSGGFDARRLTLTAPDGTEVAELVAIDPASCELVDEVLDRALGELDERLGRNVRAALLGAVASRLLSSNETGYVAGAARQDHDRPRRRVRKT